MWLRISLTKISVKTGSIELAPAPCSAPSAGTRSDALVRLSGVGIALGKRFGALHEQMHVGLGRDADLELLDQRRQRRGRLDDELEHGCARHQRLIDEAVQQVLDAPGKLAEQLSADHTAATFECMERAPRRDQRFGVL